MLASLGEAHEKSGFFRRFVKSQTLKSPDLRDLAMAIAVHSRSADAGGKKHMKMFSKSAILAGLGTALTLILAVGDWFYCIARRSGVLSASKLLTSSTVAAASMASAISFLRLSTHANFEQEGN
jgi:hypothetical protein